MEKCRLCENEKLSEYYKLDNDSIFYSCDKCGLKQLQTPPVDQLDNVAAVESISQDANRNTSPLDVRINESIGLSGPPGSCAHVLQQDSIRINKTIKKLVSESFSSPSGLKFIDIGSGYGQNSFGLKEEVPELDIHLLEISKERMNSGIESFRPDLNEFTFHHCLLDDDFSNNHFEQFDISFSFHVLEHVYNMKGFIKNMFAITKKGGYMVLEVPNEDDDLSLLSDNYRKIIHFPAHVSCFAKDTLSKLVEESGIGDKVEISFIPIQRYGFFNYVDWVRHNEKNKVLSDDYIPRENPTWIERKWLQSKKNSFTTDSIAMILKKHEK